jgi:hypothetical protein
VKTQATTAVLMLDCDVDVEEPGDECDLSSNVVLRYPSNLPFTNHVHRFDTLNRLPCRVKGPKALTSSNAAFDCSVVLLHDIVQVAYGSATTASAQFAGSLQFSDDLRIRRVPVHIDHTWPRMPSSLQRFLKEALGRVCIAMTREQEINRVAVGIDSPI